LIEIELDYFRPYEIKFRSHLVDQQHLAGDPDSYTPPASITRVDQHKEYFFS
jgi:hypothetical protein